MWQLAYMIDHLSNNLLLGISLGMIIAGFLLYLAVKLARFLPVLQAQKLLAEIIALVLLAMGFYLKGIQVDREELRNQARQAIERAEAAEQATAEANQKLQDLARQRSRVIRDNRVIVQEKIKEVERIINRECVVAPVVIDLHNQAARTPGAKQ